jgi:hypothetical protein
MGVMQKGAAMIRAILRHGKIHPLDALPEHWREGQELIVEGWEPSDDPADVKKWYDEFVALSAQIPADDHQRMAAAVAEQSRLAKEWLRDELAAAQACGRAYSSSLKAANRKPSRRMPG